MYAYNNYTFSDDDDCRIVHVSIIVLGIYTFGTSLLLWWLCKKLDTICCDSDSGGTYTYVHTYVHTVVTYVCVYIHILKL